MEVYPFNIQVVLIEPGYIVTNFQHVVKELAQSYVEAITSVRPCGPYYLAGWSMGGLIAFEIASQLEAQGQRIGLLALLDTWILAKNPAAIRQYEAMFLAGFAQELGISIGEFGVPWRYALDLGLEEKLDYLSEQCQRSAALASHISLGEFRHLLRLFLTNLQCMFAYSPQRYSGSAVLLRASEQLGEICLNSTVDWPYLVAGGLETIEVPGNHFSMMRQPYVRTLGAHLSDCIRNADDWKHIGSVAIRFGPHGIHSALAGYVEPWVAQRDTASLSG